MRPWTLDGSLAALLRPHWMQGHRGHVLIAVTALREHRTGTARSHPVCLDTEACFVACSTLWPTVLVVSGWFWWSVACLCEELLTLGTHAQSPCDPGLRTQGNRKSPDVSRKKQEVQSQARPAPTTAEMCCVPHT